MKTYKIVERKTEDKFIDTITCDICKKTYSIYKENGEVNIENEMEIQEFCFIDTTGGYSSIFGDGVRIQADICQHCLKEKLGKYLRREATEECPWNA